MYEYYRDRYEENYEQNSGLSARTAEQDFMYYDGGNDRCSIF